jgi:hypothetical protein
MVGAFLRTGRRYSSNRVVTRNEWVSVLVRVRVGHEMDLNSVAIKIPVGRTCSTVLYLVIFDVSVQRNLKTREMSIIM